MTSTNDSFIDEVTEEVRRDRFAVWLRRYGWIVLLVILVIVGGAAWIEWRQSQAQALAALRGDVLLTALEIEDADARLAALAELPAEGREATVSRLLLAAEQQGAGNADAAAETLGALATDGDADPLYRDLASLKAQMILGADADPAALDALAAPGGPFRLLALEQLALLDLAAGRPGEAVAGLAAIAEDAGLGAAQRDRVVALLTALGAPPAADADDAAAVSQ